MRATHADHSRIALAPDPGYGLASVRERFGVPAGPISLGFAMGPIIEQHLNRAPIVDRGDGTASRARHWSRAHG